MAFSQQRFLNSTVIGFTESIGLNGSSSQLVVTLVDDDAIGDSFQPGNVGRPVTFVFNNHSYTGILQSHSRVIDTGGLTYEVTITDPTELLAGVQFILDGYTGAIATENILNVYGYLESTGFGNSQKNESGLPWKNIRDTVHTLTNLPQPGTYGGPLYFLSTRYILDFSSLPDLPNDYRVGSDSISALDFISDICEAGACDFYINMVETTTGIFVIKVNTSSRTALINYGAVNEFLSSFSEYESKSSGTELANETTSKFLLGGQIREMFYKYGDLSLNTIWPFWGFDIDGNPIIGTGLGNDHTFTLDSRTVNNPRVGPYYTSDVAEIRAVLGGRASWETFLILKSGLGGIHSSKANDIGIIGYIANKTGVDLITELFNNYNNSDPDPANKKVKLDFSKLLFPHTLDNQIDYEQLDIETGYLYDFLYQIATEYYGKKFMVSIPNVSSTVEPDTGKIRVSHFPVESGFLDESLWPVAIQNNLIPLDVDRFSEEDGKIVCFVRFDSGDLLDLSELSPDSVGFNKRTQGYGIKKLENYAIFVKASADERVIFLDFANRTGPRAVITIEGTVHERVQSDDYFSKQIVVDFVNAGFSAQGIDINSQAYKTNVLDKLAGHIAQDMFNYGTFSTAVIPNLAVIPLESQTARYGPWYANGIPGKSEFEIDDSLVPWNYGGFDAMNVVAESKVTMAISLNQQIEQGDIRFPDIPLHNLGQQIGIGGPMITDISVDVGSDGAHTTYKFMRVVKQPRYGQAKAERVAQLSRTAQKIRRNLRLGATPKTKVDLSRTAKPIIIQTKQEHPKKKKTSSHEMLVGQVYEDNDGNITSSVFLQADYNFIGHVRNNYENKAYTSLDGIFVPFSTKTHSSLPSFTSPTSGAETPTVHDLSPYPSGDDPIFAKMVARDVNPGVSLYGNSPSGDYRGIALKGPLVISGPGYNSDGEIVGNRTDLTTWKTGPLDARWNEDRGVWVAGGTGNGLILATMNSSSTAVLLHGSNQVNAINWLGSTIGSGDKVYLTLDQGEYYIVNQMYYGETALSSVGCNSDGTPRYCVSSFRTPSRISRSGPSGCPT